MCKYLHVFIRFFLTFYTLFRLLFTFLPKLLHILRNLFHKLRTFGHNLDDALPYEFLHKRFAIECRAIYAALLHINTAGSAHVGDVTSLRVKAEKRLSWL